MASHTSPQKLPMYRAMLDCFGRGVRLRGEPIEFVEIPYAGTTLPALFHRAPGAVRSPAMIHFDGFDVTKEWMHLCGIAREFAARGIATLMLDHPGIGAALRLQGMAMNPESERWATAALDWLERRSNVDPRRVGVVAMSLGGYYAPRAAAFEPRLAACVAWGARWENVGSHGRILRDPNAARSVTNWVEHALWYYGAKTHRGSLREDRADDACRGLPSASPVRCWWCTASSDRQVPLDQAERTVRAAVRSPRAELRVFTEAEGGADTWAVICSLPPSTTLPTGLPRCFDDWWTSPEPKAAAVIDASAGRGHMDYVAPSTLEEAYQALDDEEARCLAGGQSLVAMMNLGLVAPSRLVSLRRIAALRGIATQPDGSLRIGAMTTHAELAAAQAPWRRGGAARAGRARRRLSGGARLRHDRRLRCACRSRPRTIRWCWWLRTRPSRSDRAAGRRRVAARDFFRGLFETALRTRRDRHRDPRSCRAAERRRRLREAVAGRRRFRHLSVAAIVAAHGADGDRRAAAPRPLLADGPRAHRRGPQRCRRASLRPKAIRPATIAAPAAYRRKVLPELVCRAVRAAQHDQQISITLNVNGEPHDVLAATPATLLDVLRSSLGLTGTKRGCNHGVCGACTVLLDGKLARSCLTLAADVGERPVRPVEGIAGNEAFPPCSAPSSRPAPSNAASAHLDSSSRSPSCLRASRIPDARPIRGRLSGNLCRCSGYVKIVEAAERLAGASA